MSSSPVGQWHPRGAVVLGVALTMTTTAALVPVRSEMSRAAPALALVVPIVVAGLAGGRGPAFATALVGALAFNLAFIPPHWTLKVAALDDGVALVVFGAVAAAIGMLVAREGERRQSAEERALELARVNRELMAVQAERELLAEEATRATVLERVDEQRSALLRSVSHDLRTPLSSIRAVASDLLAETSYDQSTRQELIGLVADEAERLDRLVANLLNLSRIEAGALHPDREAVDLEELVRHASKRLHRLLGDLRIQIDLPAGLAPVDGDYSQIDQVVSNLIENAARHAPPGSTVRVGGREAEGFVKMWIDDEGTGVAPFERDRIFDPFRRGEGSASSGIGLAICKGIVEAHGGIIHVTGAPGGGARFSFTLPVHDG
ncbi:MAG TPA: ATP-binding protein [Acidimicrobiales bacterium]|nr:ATP-binding protein [Acidimicrobiales bacterium]